MNQTELTDRDLEGYLTARSFAKSLGKEIVNNIKVGMTERDVEDVASEVFHTNGVKQHWHMPIIGVGEGSTKLRNIYALASSYLTRDTRVLQENDIILIDIAPMYNDYPSDYTINHVVGHNPDLEALAAYAHDVSYQIVNYVDQDMVVADVFHWTEELIKANSDYTLVYPTLISMGHRLCRVPAFWQNFPEPGLTYLLLKVRWPFITSSNRTLMSGLWVIEPYLMHKERAAKFEALVFVGEEPVVLD
ncbi:Xaa-Pro aminopeptidase [Candidatus Methanoperedens nitroreducens]|uniref:Xaa-Pro aminopeptidase n=1 Tax=Candidatus Methanoperedens nitratireducens TaxID=1392998 RepID=A0A062V5L2_9EURY|nr:M24 family metallopeptidase [Candidatus Methanoperedens nitroreducens]KCZ72612.1 Xaa-Pro aminopeptidase [Candidatus Methanoperedens nitroreducens]MDJ1423456.1 M24 family metallopeptidase [Candidatus Methanoperedens sp.]